MPEHANVNRSDWRWLQNTYWYVLPGNLPALQLDTDQDTLNWVIDQTVWHITGYRNGYFWGVSATLIIQDAESSLQQAPTSQPVCFTMLGTITPEGRIHLTFIRSHQPSSATPTIGIGRAIPYRDAWSLEMQMSSGADKQTAHWAYMTRVQPGDPSWESLPGVGLSVPEMLNRCKPPQLGGNSE